MPHTARLRVFTWHVHGSYLYYLSQANIEWVVPTKDGKPEGYGGRTLSFPWPNNVVEVPHELVSQEHFDVILFQSEKNYRNDQYELFSRKQLELPKIYLEHDPPRLSPTDTKHVIQDPTIQVVHVTHFNRLMWDNGIAPTTVIEHGVFVPPTNRQNTIPRGVAVVNNLGRRGRRLGADVFAAVAKEVPIDLVGMNSQQLGGLGEVPHQELPQFLSKYRFFFNPIRYTSLGLSILEAMSVGLPIVGLATTELADCIENYRTGYASTNIVKLIEFMQQLIEQPALAASIGKKSKAYAERRFGIRRFARDWEELTAQVASRSTAVNSTPFGRMFA